MVATIITAVHCQSKGLILVSHRTHRRTYINTTGKAREQRVWRRGVQERKGTESIRSGWK